MLKIKNLQVSIENKNILKELNLNINSGEIHAIMGPNGAGKSTLANVLAGKNIYHINKGSVLFNNENLLELNVEERAVKGLFLSFQYPLEIPGVTTMTFLKESINAQRKQRGNDYLTTPKFMKLVKEVAENLGITSEILRRPLNVGFSGGEKKRNEILQMMLLKPKLCILDETDSGLDIDALNIVANGVNSLKNSNRSMLIITHYQRLLEYIKPDFLHILVDGKIIKSGNKELAYEIERDGYKNITKTI